MEIKRNEATPARPLGDRVIDAPFVFVNINTVIDQLLDEEAWEKNRRNGITVFKSKGITQVITVMAKGEELKENKVNGFVTIHMLKGQALLVTEDGDFNLEREQMVSIHPNVLHSLKANSEIAFLLTNHTDD